MASRTPPPSPGPPIKRTRRELLKMTPLLGAGVLLFPSGRDWVINHGLALADAASEATFRSSHLAPTFADTAVTAFEKFPLNSYDADDPEVDMDGWRLVVEGLVQHPGEYTMDAIRKLPKVTQNTRHVCVEGWDVIGSFAGARLGAFLDAIGADPTARFVEVSCADDYYESIEIASARHPQTLLCYEMYGKPLSREHGAPVRLSIPTKLGYKSAKYLVGLRVTNVLSARTGYWEDQGYSWHGGL
jgi:DMSO/TMAO reductase YedYZ molybdopterin-dependent catalytic subunit